MKAEGSLRLAAGLLALALLDPGAAAAADGTSALPEIAVAALPAEARETIRLIRQGGPFPYERDGSMFGNYERLLPPRERGYYREYTVRTPGLPHRGARRIVAGCAPDPAARSVKGEGARAAGDSPQKSVPGGLAHEAYLPHCQGGGELFYTNDHYRSFKRIRAAADAGDGKRQRRGGS